MNNVININRVKVDNLLKQIRIQEEYKKKCQQSPLISLARLAIKLSNRKIATCKKEIKKIVKKEGCFNVQN